MLRANATGKVSEDTEQIQLMNWCRWKANQGGMWEMLDLLYHVPNGGRRGKAEASIFKAMGVKAGVPDLFLPVPMVLQSEEYAQNTHGLYIEMKAQGGRLHPSQKEWLQKLRSMGYCCRVCFGCEEAERVLEDYLEGRWPADGNTWDKSGK